MSSVPVSIDEANLTALLRQWFNYPAFRSGQLEVLRHVLAGEHTLLVMPTGSGKSLCYQLPAVMNEGLVLVISPLIALMQDQVRALQRRGVPAAALHSLQTPEEQATILRRMQGGLYRLVYVAPERLGNAAFREALPHDGVRLLAVDEAHCISQWGHDFRPAYLEIHKTWLAVGQPTILAATATATPLVQQDILEQLHLPDAARVVTGFNRPNLFFDVQDAPDEDAKLGFLQEALPQKPDGTYIIYVGTKRAAEELSEVIGTTMGLATAHYHGGLEPEVRKRVLTRFLQNQVQVLVATNAFGMGVDKPDVRGIIHWDIPGTLEEYYQEAGRAGRDGKPARCLLLYDPQDRSLQEWFINNDAPDAYGLERLHGLISKAKRNGSGQASIDEAILRRRASLTDVKLRVGISLLQRAGLLEDQGREGANLLFNVHDGVTLDAPGIMAKVEHYREHKRQLLAQMINYAETEGCRRQTILDYFGDADHTPTSPCCDLCQARGSGGQNARRETQ